MLFNHGPYMLHIYMSLLFMCYRRLILESDSGGLWLIDWLQVSSPELTHDLNLTHEESRVILGVRIHVVSWLGIYFCMSICLLIVIVRERPLWVNLWGSKGDPAPSDRSLLSELRVEYEIETRWAWDWDWRFEIVPPWLTCGGPRRAQYRLVSP